LARRGRPNAAGHIRLAWPNAAVEGGSTVLETPDDSVT
jgi:hypothetical protein